MKMDFDDGNWYAATLGHFVGLLVDGGDEAVLYRVTNDCNADERGKFKRTLEIVVIPQGQVREAISEKRPKGVHSTLVAMLEKGVVR